MHALFHNDVDNLVWHNYHFHHSFAIKPACSVLIFKSQTLNFSLVGAVCHLNVETCLSVERHCIVHVCLNKICLVEFWPGCVAHSGVVAYRMPQFLCNVRGERCEKHHKFSKHLARWHLAAASSFTQIINALTDVL